MMSVPLMVMAHIITGAVPIPMIPMRCNSGMSDRFIERRAR